MLSPLAPFLAALLTGLGSGIALASWARTAALLAADPTLVCLGSLGAILAGAAGAALLARSAASSKRPAARAAVLVLLGGAALVAGAVLATTAPPAVATRGFGLGLAALLLLPFPGMLLLGGLVPAWIAASADRRAAGRIPVPALLAILGVGLGLIAHAVGPPPLPVLLAAPFLLAAITSLVPAVRAAGGACSDQPDLDRLARAGTLIFTLAAGLAAGSAAVLAAALAPMVLPARFPAAPLTAGAFVLALALGGLLGAGLPAAWTIRTFLPVLAPAGAAFVLQKTLLVSPAPGSAAPAGAGSALASGSVALALWLAPGAIAFGLSMALAWRFFRARAAPRLRVRFVVLPAAGAVTGGLLLLVLLPFLGRETSWIPLVALVLAAAAIALAWPGASLRRIPVAVATAALIAGGLIATRPLLRSAPDPEAVRESLGPGGLVEVLESASRGGPLRVRLDRRTTFGPTSRAEERLAVRLAELPLRLHPEPRRVLLLDETTGAATAAALGPPEFAVDCTWLEAPLRCHFGPELAARARRTGHVLKQPAAGARMLLASRPGAYDVIVGLEPAGRTDRPVSGLTEGYFRTARRALRPGGLLAVWLPLDRLSGAETAAAVAAFLTAFPTSASAWLPSILFSRPVLGLIGTAEDAPVTGRPLSAHPVAGVAPELGDVPSLLALEIADADALRRQFPASGATDRRPFLRYREDGSLARPDRGVALETLTALLLLPAPQPPRRHPAAAVALPVARELRLLQLARLRARNGADGAPAPSPMASLLQAHDGARRALQHTPDLGFVRCFVDDVAHALRASGLASESRTLYELATEQAPDWGGGYLGLADAVFASHAQFRTAKDWELLEALAEAALQRDEHLARAWIYLGIAHYHGRNDPARARGCLENAAKIDPDDPLLKSHLWRFFEQDGRTEEAAAMLLDAADAFPEDARLRDALLNVVPKLRLAGKSAQGLYVLQFIAGGYRTDARYFLTLAEVLEALDDGAGAIEAMRRCCGLTPRPLQGYYLHLYRLLRKYDRAREANETRSFFKAQFDADPEDLLSGS